ncbi:CRISPR-associated endonuclease Cas2 [Paucilactobacillus suebicus]|uniref:CRISPR-associated endonuclease Cas2 n=1 Tax=Paucilactobacillus suebicus TaxID=152335 RepID=UPI000249086E|nr:CRISPR-associated endonuclease Cas2 [Paucilactobacillus suebicus]
MLIVVAYDISITTENGTKRLSKVAKICLKYGQRVQNSVYECNIDTLNYKKLRNELIDTIDCSYDSVRFYNLGKNYENKIIHFGSKTINNVDSPLIL